MGKQQELRKQRQELRKKRAESHIPIDNLPEFNRKTVFHNFAELVTAAKDSIFLIARLRKIDDNQTQVRTLGTGFLVGNARMMTNSHVMNGEEDPHQDGDLYKFVMRNEDGRFHQSLAIALKIDETLFDFPDQDVAIIYLPREFYFDAKDSMVHHPEDYLVLASSQRNIGTDIGVLGYPMQAISVNNNGELDMSGVIIRGDKGVVNTRYLNDKVHYYDFTVSFYPGNSGGPIFDIENGEVVAIVKGYRSVPIKFTKEAIPENLHSDLGAKEAVSSIRSTYSFGLSSQNYIKLKDEHDICFR